MECADVRFMECTDASLLECADGRFMEFANVYLMKCVVECAVVHDLDKLWDVTRRFYLSLEQLAAAASESMASDQTNHKHVIKLPSTHTRCDVNEVDGWDYGCCLNLFVDGLVQTFFYAYVNEGVNECAINDMRMWGYTRYADVGT